MAYTLFLQLFVAALLVNLGSCLQCLTGLGNTSKKKLMETVTCPEHERYVCLKMFGGGMGDQIRRKCIKLDEEAYSELLQNEEAKLRAEETGEYLEGIHGDPACHATTDHGRKVKVCYCTQDLCNGADKRGFNITVMVVMMASWICGMMIS